ncbi:MAG TPA: ATP-binding protein [Pyrinomonadaceae bacterium]|jgi:two-component system chemotaxis sensor kinase CheA|nr:ATP-binding protein [Pyrinomonadaceae bacterium]
MDEQLLKEFLAEADELIAGLYADVEALRERRGEGRARREVLAGLFRKAHTFKGSAAAAGLAGAAGLAHEFESLLDAVRLGRRQADDAALDASETAVGALDALLREAARGRERAAPAELLDRLRELSAGGAGSPDAGHGAEAALPADVADALSAQERRRLREAADEGARVFLVEADFLIENFDEEFRRLGEGLRERGELVATVPGAHESEPERVRFRVVYATTEGRAETEARVAPLGARVAGVEEDEGQAGWTSSPALDVRVPLGELDELVSAAHELFTEAAQVLDAAASSAGGEGLESKAARVRRGFVEFEERLIGLRMVPLAATLERAARGARAAARAAGREVEFETKGGAVRIDKSLAERAAEPLLHLLRNAVDHGVEAPRERRAAGKAERGRVRVEVQSEGGLFILRVADDGRGIDPARVARAAIARGIVAAGARVTQEQALRLIFRPGFSTAEAVTPVSGRGVGLDVVERAVEQAGGQLRVWSEPGRGATFEMRLPMTLALVHAVVVRAGGWRYCLDAGHVAEAGDAGAQHELKEEGGRALLRWRGLDLPLVTLRGLLSGEGVKDGDGGRGAFVVARAGEGRERHVAVAVDGVEGRRDVLVRSLGRHAARWPGVSGATEMPDGEAALVLDLPRLLEEELKI